MEATVAYDTALRRLLQPLLAVRHPHLRPLLAVQVSDATLSLHYGQSAPCTTGCEGLRGAMRAVHAAGLWVGNMLEAIGLDDLGRVVLSDVGAHWDLADPFAGHPSTSGYDLRVAWRQRGDDLQLRDLECDLTQCA